VRRFDREFSVKGVYRTLEDNGSSIGTRGEGLITVLSRSMTVYSWYMRLGNHRTSKQDRRLRTAEGVSLNAEKPIIETSSLLSSGNARLCFHGSHSTNGGDTAKRSYYAICTTTRTYIHGAHPPRPRSHQLE